MVILKNSFFPEKIPQPREYTIVSLAKIVLGLSLSDLPTFILPNILFGICTALYNPMWGTKSSSLSTISQSIRWNSLAASVLQTILWNWLNLLLFNLSNQRLPDAIIEDRLNKPYRPIPRGLLKPATARRVMLYGIPAMVLISYFWLGAYEESIVLVGLTWMYNDLKGSDESFLLRNLIVAVSSGVYNHASSRIARGWLYSGMIKEGHLEDPALNMAGQQWIMLTILIILTTIQIQDLRDVEGDRKRGRQTMMVALGTRTSRWCTAIPVFAWSLIVPYILGAGTSLPQMLSVGLGIYTAWRVIFLTKRKQDDRSRTIWALWLIALYTLPLANGVF